MEQERLLDYKKLEVRRLKSADEDIINLLSSTVLGSEGGMRYTMLNTPERIRSYGDRLSFVALYKRNSLKGVIGLCRRITSNHGLRYSSAYLRYLAVQSAFQVNRAPGRRKERTSDAADTFKQKILALFRDPMQAAGPDEAGGAGMGGSTGDVVSGGGASGSFVSGGSASDSFVSCGGSISDGPRGDGSGVVSNVSGAGGAGSSNGGNEGGTGGPNVLYAYVESRNERSRNLINQAGYEYIRSFLTVAFSRFNPKPHPSVSRLSPAEEPAMAQLLSDFYSDYCFYSDEFSFHDNKYYVLRRNGEIVAGVGAIPARYRVVNVPGLWGWMMMKVLPRTPYFRRLFQPEEFRYVILNAIYCRRGSENLLPDLFDAVCAGEGYHTALTWLDDHSWLYETLRTNRRMGALNRMLNAKPGLVYALFPGLTREETEKFYDSPAYISGFDFS